MDWFFQRYNNLHIHCKVFCCSITEGLWNVAQRKGCWFDKAEAHIRFLQIQQTGRNKLYREYFFKDLFFLFFQLSTFSEAVVSGSSITRPKKRQWFLINKEVVFIINDDKSFGDDCLPSHRNTNKKRTLCRSYCQISLIWQLCSSGMQCWWVTKFSKQASISPLRYCCWKCVFSYTASKMSHYTLLCSAEELPLVTENSVHACVEISGQHTEC